MLPRASAPLQEAVELWARSRGTHARIGWDVQLRCFQIEFELPADHPRMLAWQEGKLKRKPTESVPLHRHDGKRYVMVDIEQLGASGLREWLDKADMLSGQGEYNTLYEAMRAVAKKNEANRDANVTRADELGREMAWLLRRRVFGLPMTQVLDNTARNHADSG